MLTNRSMPRGPVIPVLGYPDVAEAAQWLGAAFGFAVRLRIGNHRVQMMVGEGAVVLAENADPAPQSVMVRVADVDAQCEHAALMGAKVLQAPATVPFGERQCAVEDPAGHRWHFSQTVADVDPAEWGGELL